MPRNSQSLPPPRRMIHADADCEAATEDEAVKKAAVRFKLHAPKLMAVRRSEIALVIREATCSRAPMVSRGFFRSVTSFVFCRGEKRAAPVTCHHVAINRQNQLLGE
jgi:hypothetical protein